MSKHHNKLTDRLFQALKERKLSVPSFSKETGIPSARIYKWKVEGGPKAEDAEKITKWLNGEISKPGINAARETEQVLGNEHAPGLVPAEDLIQVLKEHNEFLRRNFELSLTGISVQAASILAHVSTSLEKDDEREAAGDKQKLQQIRIDTGKRIAEMLGGVVNKNNNVASK